MARTVLQAARDMYSSFPLVSGFDAATAGRASALGLATGAMGAARANANWIFDRSYMRSSVPAAAIGRSLSTFSYPPRTSQYTQNIGRPVYQSTRQGSSFISRLFTGRNTPTPVAGTAARALGTGIRGSWFGGLGDVGSGAAAGSPASGDWSAWANVLTAFAAPIGEGLGRAIKQEPGSTTIMQQAPAVPETPKWVLPAAVAGGGLALFLILKK